jgi:transportin-3
MLISMIDYAPDVFFESSAFQVAFRAAMASLTLIQTEIVFATLDLFRFILTHDCLHPHDAMSPPPPKFPLYANAVNRVMEKEGQDLVGLLLSGITGDFPEDSSGMTIAIFRALVSLWPQQLLQWLEPALQSLPPATVPDDAKTRFLNEVST